MFVGSKREAAVADLLSVYDTVRSEQRPQVVVIESETGLGKTKILQEFYARLAAERQGLPPYWPDRIDQHTTGAVLRDRKRIKPETPFTIAGGATMKYLWWGIACVDSEDGEPVPRLVESARDFTVHARQLAEAQPDHVDTALTFAQEVLDLVGLANPIKLAVGTLDAAKLSASWIQRLRRKSKALPTLDGDTRIDPSLLPEDERTALLATAVRNAANAGLAIVVVVDDAHSADPGLIGFLRQLTQIDNGAVMIVLSLWPSRVSTAMDGTSGTVGSLLSSTEGLLQSRFSRIELGKLERAGVEQLLLEVAPKTERPIIDQFCDVVDGNPLLLRLYLGLDRIKNDISADGKLDTPPSVIGGLPSDARQVWQGLWSQLPEPTRVALAIASMQGNEFDPRFVDRAATDLHRFDAYQDGYLGASSRLGWIDSDDVVGVFTERPRFEVAKAHQREQFDDQQLEVVRRSLAMHVFESRESPTWTDRPAMPRRNMLRAAIDVVIGGSAVVPSATAAEAAFDLSLLEEELGDPAAALSAAREAVEFASGDERTAGESMVVYRTRLGLLEREAGNVEEAFEEINRAEELSREVFGADNEATTMLQDEVSELAVATPVAAEVHSGAWVAWQPITSPGLFDGPIGPLVDIVVAITAAEGPLTLRRLHKLAGRASGAKVVGRNMREQVDKAVGMASRRHLLTALNPYRGCPTEERVVHLAGKSSVVVRDRGDRELDEIPFTEYAAVAELFLRENAGADIDATRRAVMAAYGIRRLTDNVSALTDRAISIARREVAKAAKQNEVWADVHRAIAAIPDSRWTSVTDLAELAGTSTGWVGRHLYGLWELPGLHRVFEADGRPWRWFHWPEGSDRGDVIDVLTAEGSLADGVGQPEARLSKADLENLLGLA